MNSKKLTEEIVDQIYEGFGIDFRQDMDLQGRNPNQHNAGSRRRYLHYGWIPDGSYPADFYRAKGDRYTCTYGCPVNAQGQGICPKLMMIMFPVMEAVRSGRNLENIGGSGKYVKDIVCPDGCVMFRLTAKKLGNENFYKGKFYEEAGNGI